MSVDIDLNKESLKWLIRRSKQSGEAARNITFCVPHREYRIDIDDDHFAWLYISEKNLELLQEERSNARVQTD